MPKTNAPCDIARERYGPSVKFKLADYDKHVEHCAQCTAHRRSLKRTQRTRTNYSKSYPLTGDVHRYLLIAPGEVWKRATKRAAGDAVSVRFVLNALLDHYASHGLPAGSMPAPTRSTR